MTTIRLPWPPSALSSNGAHGHWRRKAAATKAYRLDAWALAKAAGVPRTPGAVLTFTYCPPDRRRRDVANMAIPMKAAIDGIADAMGCDDHGFRPRFPDAFGNVVPGGQIIVEVTP